MIIKTREHKGSNLLEFVSNYVVLDIEATDFSYFYGDIIEITINRYQDFELVETYQSLINIDSAIPDHIIKLTGITDEILHDAPSLSDISQEIIDFIGNDIIVGHNVNFDINFLYDSMSEDGLYIKNDFIDTLRLSRIFITDSPNHKLITLSVHLGLNEPAHRSLNDVIATNDLYLFLVNKNNESPHILAERFLRKKSKAFDLTTIVANTEYDDSHIFYKKAFCFTGKMDVLTKSEAAQLVANLGGKTLNNVTNKTDILVLGNLEYQHKHYGKKSSKHLLAEQMQQKDHHIEIITERDFLDMLGQ